MSNAQSRFGLACLAVTLLLVSGTGGDTAHAKSAKTSRLKPFSSCKGLVRYAQSHAPKFRDEVAPPNADTPTGGAPGTGELKQQAPASPTPGQDFSETNVQEAGIDEPDIVKTDGSRIYAIAGGRLHAVDVSGERPRRLGSLELEGSSHQLLIKGERALVISDTFTPSPGPVARSADIVAPGSNGATLTEVDLGDPSKLRIVSTMTMDASFVDARLSGSTARVVMTAQPDGLEGARPTRTASWVPSAAIENRRTKKRTTRRLVGCSSVRHPAKFSGLDMLTVLTIDLAKGLEPVDSDAVMTDGETVYSSAEGLYVATERWQDPDTDPERLASGSTTAIHKFDVSRPDATVYRVSGQVRGFLLNQFALSEHKGFLRAASTTTADGANPNDDIDSESFVTVLEERGGRLEQVGRVGGLGRGEEIYSVRFIGDVGYVVTFRQTDPLYTLDLATPSQPKILGELKIRGYSAYLHPVGDNLLLGVGQDADGAGAVKGTQLSLFDVSDLRRPTRLHQRTLSSNTYSEAEYDHHAFLYWAPTGLAVLPVFDNSEDEGTATAIGFQLSRAQGIRQVGRVSHRSHAPGATVSRSLVVRDKLYTLSEAGLAASKLDTLAELDWVPFEN